MFLVSRMREATPTEPSRPQPWSAGSARGARVVTAAALIMMAVFSGFIFGDDAQIKSVGFALAFGVLAERASWCAWPSSRQ